MADDAMAGLFDSDDVGDEAAEHALYEQDGPDLFGMDTEELILPTEPTPTDDPEMEIELDQMGEIPIDPDEDAADEATVDESIADEPEAAESSDPEVQAAAAEAASAPQITPDPNQGPAKRSDAPLALYRRYRPETFDQVIGEEHVTEPLQRALLNNRVNHAYLFSGPRGCGKTTSARILARCLNCEQGPTPTPCGVCQSCRDLARGGAGSIDVIEIDAASHGGVDEARDLRERAFYAPVHRRYKIYIIDEAHMVTNAGFNALLKVVEEPPPHVKFIFATTEPEKVIGTIRSRTHHYPFRLVPPRTLTAYLAELCEAEGVQVDHAVLPLVVRAGAGSVRDSLSVLDQLLGGAGDAGVTYQQAAALLGYTPESLLDEIVDAFAAGDAHGVFACIDKVIEVGQDPRRFGEDLLRRLRDLIIVAAVPDALETGLVDVAADQAERLTTQAAGMGAGELTRAAEVIAQGLTDMRGTTAPRLHLELMCARVLLPGADVDERGVHARLDRLERRLQMLPGADGHAGEAAAGAHGGDRPASEPWGAAERPDAEGARGARRPSGADAPAGQSPARRPAGAESVVRGERQGGERAEAEPHEPRSDGAVSRDRAGDNRGQAAGESHGGRGERPAPGERRGDTELADGSASDAGHGGGAGAEVGAHARPVPDGGPQAPEPSGSREPADWQPQAEPPEDPWADEHRPEPARPASQSGRRPRSESPAPHAGGEQAPAASGWSVNVGSRREQPAERAPEPQQQQAPAPQPGGADPAQLSTADVRGRWPEVLDAVRRRRRVTWIILRENAQVHGFADGVLTLALNNPGALESFSRGGSDQIVREAVLEVFGVAPNVQVIPGSGEAEAAVPSAPEPSAPAAPAAAPRSEPSPNLYAEAARANIQPTQVGQSEEPEPVESPDDLDVDDEPLGSGELLAKVLGAELIAEEDPNQP